MCGQGQEVVTCDPTPKVGRVTGIEKIAPATQKGGGVTSDHGPGVTQELLRNFSEASKILHLPHKKNVRPRRTSRRHRKYSPATQGSRVTENFSDASKILHLPHKVSVCHLRLFPTSKYTVRGQHLGGIEIVAPATQNPWQGSQIVYRVTSDPNVGRVTQLVDVWAGPGSSHLRPYPKGR